ncbi:MAG: hypothetical protein ACREL9_05980 [Gemmatimonadales bacterium]
MLAVSTATVVCPKCRGALTVKRAPGSGQQVVWELRCGFCARTLVVSDLTKS